jgi:hypothetical protein
LCVWNSSGLSMNSASYCVLVDCSVTGQFPVLSSTGVWILRNWVGTHRFAFFLYGSDGKVPSFVTQSYFRSFCKIALYFSSSCAILW